MTMGLVGIALAALVVVVGTATAYDAQLVRGSAPPGVNPHSFFVLPMLDMALFVIFFAGAIYYRKRPAEHKTLMLMTAIAFMPAALFRLHIVPPQMMIHWAFGAPMLAAPGFSVPGLSPQLPPPVTAPAELASSGTGLSGTPAGLPLLVVAVAAVAVAAAGAGQVAEVRRRRTAGARA